MDYSESTKVVFQRIEKLDPENVSKIVGHLLLKDHGQLEMIRLAFCPDTVIQSTIHTVKRELSHSLSSPTDVSSTPYNNNAKLSNLTANFTPFTPSWSSASVPPENSQWIVPTAHDQPLVQDFQYFPVAFVEPSPSPPPAAAGGGGGGGGYILHEHKQPQIVFVDDQARPIIMPDQRCSHFPESTAQICQSFNKGYCKYGGSCQFLHMLRMENGSFMVLNPPPKTQTGAEDNYPLSRESLKQLEIELIALLKARRAVPVSISSLPIFYYDKYGRVLQVEGYIMEVPGQGKVSFNLTQLISWMTKGICLIDRPHGRQSIILVEDIPRYVRLIEVQSGEDEWKSCQVYLTFPPHSMFSEEDVYNYFNNFGPVQEVRLPNQEKRMFGFVTFVYPETVGLVLTKTNPHFICGAKVLVKPYRMKPMLVDRKPGERVQHPIQLGLYLGDEESRPCSITNEKMKFPKKQVIEGRGNKKHIFVGQTSSESEDASSSFIQGVLSNGCTSDEDRVYHIKAWNYYYSQESSSFDEVNLPESPFGYEEEVANGVWPLM